MATILGVERGFHHGNGECLSEVKRILNRETTEIVVYSLMDLGQKENVTSVYWDVVGGDPLGEVHARGALKKIKPASPFFGIIADTGESNQYPHWKDRFSKIGQLVVEEHIKKSGKPQLLFACGSHVDESLVSFVALVSNSGVSIIMDQGKHSQVQTIPNDKLTKGKFKAEIDEMIRFYRSFEIKDRIEILLNEGRDTILNIMADDFSKKIEGLKYGMLWEKIDPIEFINYIVWNVQQMKYLPDDVKQKILTGEWTHEHYPFHFHPAMSAYEKLWPFEGTFWRSQIEVKPGTLNILIPTEMSRKAIGWSREENLNYGELQNQYTSEHQRGDPYTKSPGDHYPSRDLVLDLRDHIFVTGVRSNENIPPCCPINQAFYPYTSGKRFQPALEYSLLQVLCELHS